MPRKSLPSGTPRTHSLPARSQSTLKRSATARSAISHHKRKRSSPDPIALVDEHEHVQEHEPDQDLEHEKDLEAWQDFAAEHYEIVEQLPLELHRNFRLLRELDDGSVGEWSLPRQRFPVDLSCRAILLLTLARTSCSTARQASIPHAIVHHPASCYLQLPNERGSYQRRRQR